jgi:hypothetical protein
MKHFILLLLLTSCSAEWHFGKFIKKGGKVEPKIELVEYTDTIKVNGKDSIILVRVPVTCPDVKIPEPRWRTKLEYRYKYKIHRDTVRLNRDVVKYQYKTVKVQEKRSNWLYWFIAGLVVYAVGSFLVKRVL